MVYHFGHGFESSSWQQVRFANSSVTRLTAAYFLLQLRDFMNNLSSPDQAEVFGAIADLLDLVKDLDSIKQLGETWAWLGESAGWMLPLLNFVEKLTSEFSMEDLAL